MRKQVVIVNRLSGPFKVPFKKDAPADIQAQTHGIIAVGQKRNVPPELYDYLDMDRLEFASKRRYIKLTVRDMPERTIYPEPKRVGRPLKKAKEIKATDVEEDTEVAVDEDKKEDR